MATAASTRVISRITELKQQLEAADDAIVERDHTIAEQREIIRKQRLEIARLPAAEQTLIEKLTQFAFIVALAAAMLAVPFAMLPDVQAFVCSVVP